MRSSLDPRIDAGSTRGRLDDLRVNAVLLQNRIEKLRSGDIYQVAEVVRNLAIRERQKGLSAGEKRMFTKARQILVSELVFATGGTEEKAESMIDKVLDESH